MKDVKTLLDAMQDCEYRIGEDCVEYCGSGETFAFAQFLQTALPVRFTNEQLEECKSPSMAYFDVVDLLLDDHEEEELELQLQGKLSIDLAEYSLGLDAKLTAYYWFTSEKSEREFDEFVKSFLPASDGVEFRDADAF